MEWTSVLVAVVSGVTAIIVAVIAARQEADRRVREARRLVREERDELQIDMIAATVEVSLVTAKKLNRQETNGDVEKAIASAEAAKLRYKKFCERSAQKI